MGEMALRARIRTRLSAIEKTLVRHLGEDRVQRLQESIHRRFEMDGKALRKSGITRPTLSTKNLFSDG
jgi:geranylgeranyl pyrophosphate synthase